MEPTSERFPERSSAWEPAGTPCLNCKRELIGPYCHHCGQKEQDLDVRFTELMADWLGGVVGFDARIWSTLRVLFRWPGQLTLEFLEGRRARYVSPFRLYLVSSLLMLLGLAFFEGSVINSEGGLVQINTGSQDDLPEEVEEAFDALEDLGALGAPGTAAKAVAGTGGGGDGPGASGGAGDVGEAADPGAADTETSDDSTGDLSAASDDPEAESSPNGDGADGFVDGVLDGVGDGMDRLENAAEDEQALDRSFRDQLPKMLFLLVPVFAAQLWFLFRR
ncbi:MAG: DUF3667 domain-containing protein [Acidobacteriota bacterium]